MADADGELPRANVRKLVKARLAELGADGDGRDVQINKDALAAFSEAAKIFIHYLTSTASDMCQETKRSTIIADDVLKAISELDFGDLAPPLEAALESASCAPSHVCCGWRAAPRILLPWPPPSFLAAVAIASRERDVAAAARL